MTTKKFKAFMIVLFMAICVHAADRIWSGNGSDALWSSPANWGGSAPMANDTLHFGGTKVTSVNDLPEGTSFAGIIFNSGASAFALSGNGITLAGNVTNLSTTAQTIDLPLALPQDCEFNTSIGGITLDGMLSGSGGVTKLGSKTLKLTASNSYDGVTVVNDGVLWISHASALGSTNGNTVVNGKTSGNNGNLQLSGDIVVAEPLVLNGERSGNLSSMYNSSGSNTWSGPITKQGQIRIHGAASSTLVIKGGLTGNGGMLVLNSPGTIAFNTKPISIGGGSLYTESSGITVIGVAGNVWGFTRLVGGSGTLRLDIENGLPVTTSLQLGYRASSPSYKFCVHSRQFNTID